MNKLLILAVLVSCLAVATAQQDGKYGGYQKIDFTDEHHKQAFAVAVQYLQEKGGVTANAVPHLEQFYQKIVSGIIYKFVISFGQEVYQIEIWSQPWLNKLDVQAFKKLTPAN